MPQSYSGQDADAAYTLGLEKDIACFMDYICGWDLPVSKQCLETILKRILLVPLRMFSV